jgi:small subunit ribosomal protein S7
MNIQDKMVNTLMLSGKKLQAEKILFTCFQVLEKVYKKEGETTLEQAITNTIPAFEIRTIRIAGRTQQIPFPIKKDKQYSLALKWIVMGSKTNNKRSFPEKLAFEIHEASIGNGHAVKKRNEVHKNAESNRAFAHFRWC